MLRTPCFFLFLDPQNDNDDCNISHLGGPDRKKRHDLKSVPTTAGIHTTWHRSWEAVQIYCFFRCADQTLKTAEKSGWEKTAGVEFWTESESNVSFKLSWVWDVSWIPSWVWVLSWIVGWQWVFNSELNLNSELKSELTLSSLSLTWGVMSMTGVPLSLSSEWNCSSQLWVPS